MSLKICLSISKIFTYCGRCMNNSSLWVHLPVVYLIFNQNKFVLSFLFTCIVHCRYCWYQYPISNIQILFNTYFKHFDTWWQDGILSISNASSSVMVVSELNTSTVTFHSFSLCSLSLSSFENKSLPGCVLILSLKPHHSDWNTPTLT